MQEQKVIDYFEIPDELAQELSALLIKQNIRERLLLQLSNDEVKYESVENKLISIISRIEVIKNLITTEYVPKKYNDQRYMWNYNSWEVDNNKVEILE